MTVQLEAFSVAIEIDPDTCDTCGEIKEDCIPCDLCESCQDDCECMSCERCGKTMDDCDATTVNLGYNYNARSDVSEFWCGKCVRRNATTCDGCGDYHAGDSYTYTMSCCDRELCEDCRGYSMYCESCEVDYCEGCNHYGCSSEFVGGYHSGNPEGTQFHGSGKWHMGVELELDADAGDAAAVLDILGGHSHVHLEEDGSVRGFEAIFQPRTLDSWVEYLTAGKFSALRRVVDAGDNGLHVHVSKAAFKSGNALRRFAEIMSGRKCDDSKAMLEALAGRPENSWAMFEDHNRKDVAKSGLKGYVPQRYRGAVNLNTSTGKTVELRLGASTLNHAQFMGWIQTIAAAVVWANAMTLELEALGGCNALALCDYVAGKPEYQHADAAMRHWALGQF